MFIRRTQTRTTTTGETYFTHRLVRSERVGDKVRQRTLLNLGRHFDAAQNDWPALCRRIEEVLGGQLQLAPGLVILLYKLLSRTGAGGSEKGSRRAMPVR